MTLFLAACGKATPTPEALALATATGSSPEPSKTAPPPTPEKPTNCPKINRNDPNAKNLWRLYLALGGKDGIYQFRDTGYLGTGLVDNITIPGEYIGQNGPVHDGDELCYLGPGSNATPTPSNPDTLNPQGKWQTKALPQTTRQTGIIFHR